MTADVVSPSPDSPPERLLDAAERLVSEVGAGHLTLEAVARAAGVSKGGLLYHFPSKEALLQAMIDRHLRDIGARIAGLEADGRSCDGLESEVRGTGLRDEPFGGIQQPFRRRVRRRRDDVRCHRRFR